MESHELEGAGGLERAVGPFSVVAYSARQMEPTAESWDKGKKNVLLSRNGNLMGKA